MLIRRARLSDVDTIEAWRAERLAWFASRGSDQWSNHMPRRVLDDAVRAGLTWLVWDGVVPVATLTVLSYEDAPQWPDGSGEALYVTKMVASRRFAGLRIGAEMLAWAGGRAYGAGLTWLRLDAWTTSAGLHRYYRGLGFDHVRTVPGLSGACFQRAAAPYRGFLLDRRE